MMKRERAKSIGRVSAPSVEPAALVTCVHRLQFLWENMTGGNDPKDAPADKNFANHGFTPVDTLPRIATDVPTTNGNAKQY